LTAESNGAKGTHIRPYLQKFQILILWGNQYLWQGDDRTTTLGQVEITHCREQRLSGLKFKIMENEGLDKKLSNPINYINLETTLRVLPKSCYLLDP
jgi:hypothetical protein